MGGSVLLTKLVAVPGTPIVLLTAPALRPENNRLRPASNYSLLWSSLFDVQHTVLAETSCSGSASSMTMFLCKFEPNVRQKFPCSECLCLSYCLHFRRNRGLLRGIGWRLLGSWHCSCKSLPKRMLRRLQQLRWLLVAEWQVWVLSLSCTSLFFLSVESTCTRLGVLRLVI